jgi:predicted NBD/HSP70 family sugar kinase
MVSGAIPGDAPVRNAVGSPTALRDANRDRVLDRLRRSGTSSQSDLARATGLSRATVMNIVRDLAGRNLVTVAEGQHGGRRTADVSFNSEAGAVVGIDFGHRHLRIAVADLGHTVLAEDTRRLKLGHSARDDLELVVDCFDTLLAQSGVARDNVLGVAVGLPAPVDPVSGQVGSSSILPGWVGVPAAQTVSDALGMPVVVDNDANLGALAELLWGAGQGCDDLVYIKVSTGIGAGLIMQGQIYRGAAGTAGEIGHMTIDETGPVCRCGNRGCLESYAGAPALVKLLGENHGPGLTLQRLIELAFGGDPGARRVLGDGGRHLGIAVANLCNLMAPQRVVVGGELADAGPMLIEPIREAVQRRSIPTAANAAQIVTADLGERAEVMGAVARALLSTSFGRLMRAPP